MTKIAVKTPDGYLLIETKGDENDYPGIYVSKSKDGINTEATDMISCTEYDTNTEEYITRCYSEQSDEPISVIQFKDGKDRIKS